MPKSPQFMDNPNSDRVRHVSDLASAKTRKKTGKFLVEGPQAVREAVEHRPDLIEDLYIDRSANPPTEVISQALRENIYVHETSTEVLQRMSADAQSLLAVGHSEGLFGSLGNLNTRNGNLFAACWQVRDPGNEGTVIRTADASGCAAVILVGECVDPLNPKVIRSTTGSLFHVPVIRASEDEFFAWASQSGVPVWAADTHGTEQKPPVDLAHFAFGEQARQKLEQQATAILFGNEARGLPSQLVAKAEQTLTIPLYGKAESLNLAMSSAVLLYTLAMSSHVERM